jgi:hypothetical protein
MMQIPTQEQTKKALLDLQDRLDKGYDVRLQVLNSTWKDANSWNISYGAPDLEIDRRGFWGVSFLHPRMTEIQIERVAAELREQVEQNNRFSMIGATMRYRFEIAELKSELRKEQEANRILFEQLQKLKKSKEDNLGLNA